MFSDTKFQKTVLCRMFCPRFKKRPTKSWYKWAFDLDPEVKVVLKQWHEIASETNSKSLRLKTSLDLVDFGNF